MGSFIQTHKTAIIIVLVVALGFIGYSVFFVGGEDVDEVTTVVATPADPGADLLALLLTLRSINLSGEIFDDTEFKSLEDFSQALQPEPVGRNNPFAPIGQ